jgi:hypothetical protein
MENRALEISLKNCTNKSNMLFTTMLERGSLDRILFDQNCLFSVDRKFHFQLIKFFETFHLIETFNNVFNQTPKQLSVDQKFY